MKCFGLLIAALLGAASTSFAEEEGPIVVYYYTQWAQWARQFCLDQFLDTTKFKGTTHIQYAFHYPDASCQITSNDEQPDTGAIGWTHICEQKCPGTPSDNSSSSPDRANIGCLKKLSADRGIKMGISLGGWTLSMHFSDCVTDNDKRSTMVSSIVEQVEYFGWDFVDFDWEYPHGGGNDDTGGMHGRDSDWENFKVMIGELRTALEEAGKGDIKLTGAFGMNPYLLLGEDPYVHPTPMAWLCQNLDFVSTMSYDLMGGWEKMTGWPAPLYHDTDAPYKDADKLNIKWHLDLWKRECGTDFKKVILGLPAYAKSWRSVPAGDAGNGMYEECSWEGDGPDAYPEMPCLGDGSFLDTAGTLEIWDIHAIYLPDSNCHHYYQTVAKQDFVYCRGEMYADNAAHDIWFAYDGPEVFWEKTKVAKEMGMGGFMFWEPAYTALGIETDPIAMVPKKKAKLDEVRPDLETEYFWAPYEDACFAGWNGEVVDAFVSDGERVPDDGGGGGGGGGDGDGTEFTCDSVASGSVSDGSVSSGCMLSFCTHACETFMGGVCSSHDDAAQCVADEIANLPPNGQSGISCTFS